MLSWRTRTSVNFDKIQSVRFWTIEAPTLRRVLQFAECILLQVGPSSCRGWLHSRAGLTLLGQLWFGWAKQMLSRAWRIPGRRILSELRSVICCTLGLRIMASEAVVMSLWL